MKKFRISFSIVLLLSIFLNVCNAEAKVNSKDKAIHAQGLAIVSVMEEMVQNETWFDVFSHNKDLKKIISDEGKIGKKKLKTVYQIKINNELNSYLIEPINEKRLSPDLNKYFQNIIQTCIATNINTIGGADIIAASGICTYSKTFVNNDIKENTSYLYTFEKGAPILITFIVGDDNAVSAHASYIFYDGFGRKNIEEMEAILEGFGASIEEISLK